MENIPVEATLYSLSDDPPARGRRGDENRQLTLFRVGSLMIGKRRELCLIKNISAGGMLIRAYCPVEAGARLSVELKCGEPVDGTVCWVDGDSVGVTFDKPIDVVEILATSMKGPRPRMPRIAIDCVAWVREGAMVHRLQALDVSQGGLKVAGRQTPPIGADVMITLPGLAPIAGTVRWAAAGCCGVTFNKVVPLSSLVAWLNDQRERMRRTG